MIRNERDAEEQNERNHPKSEPEEKPEHSRKAYHYSAKL